MTPAETTIFAHHDKINDCKSGTVLLVAEPCKVVNMEQGGTIDVAQGQHLRVRCRGGGLMCDLAMHGRVHSVTLQPAYFHCVDVAPTAAKKSRKTA